MISTGRPPVKVEPKSAFVDQPYPNGESWRQALGRVAGFLDDLTPRSEGARVLVIGYVATLLGFRLAIEFRPVEKLVSAEFHWQPGWEFRLEAPGRGKGRSRLQA